jgi:hypothetical protein
MLSFCILCDLTVLLVFIPRSWHPCGALSLLTELLVLLATLRHSWRPWTMRGRTGSFGDHVVIKLQDIRNAGHDNLLWIVSDHVVFSNLKPRCAFSVYLTSSTLTEVAITLRKWKKPLSTSYHCKSQVHEIIDTVFAKTSPKRSFSMTEYERFGLVFTKTRVYKFGQRNQGNSTLHSPVLQLYFYKGCTMGGELSKYCPTILI